MIYDLWEYKTDLGGLLAYNLCYEMLQIDLIAEIDSKKDTRKSFLNMLFKACWVNFEILQDTHWDLDA